MKIGDVYTWERTFTDEDVRQFSRVSGDEGTHHIEADGQGRLMVHGLLTATLPTKIGGDINFLAREMNLQFHRPVFAGDTVRCEVSLTELEETEQYTRLASDVVCRNQHGKEVMTGSARGIIRPQSK